MILEMMSDSDYLDIHMKMNTLPMNCLCATPIDQRRRSASRRSDLPYRGRGWQGAKSHSFLT